MVTTKKRKQNNEKQTLRGITTKLSYQMSR